MTAFSWFLFIMAPILFVVIFGVTVFLWLFVIVAVDSCIKTILPPVNTKQNVTLTGNEKETAR